MWLYPVGRPNNHRNAQTLMSSEHNHSHTDVQRTQTQHHSHTITAHHSQQQYLKRRNTVHTQIHDVPYTPDARPANTLVNTQMHQVYQTMISSSLTFVYELFGHVKPPRKCHHFGKANWEALRTELSRAGKGVHDLWKTFKSQLFDAIDKHIPSALRSGKHQLPWMNGKLRRLIKKKRRL